MWWRWGGGGDSQRCDSQISLKSWNKWCNEQNMSTKRVHQAVNSIWHLSKNKPWPDCILFKSIILKPCQDSNNFQSTYQRTTIKIIRSSHKNRSPHFLRLHLLANSCCHLPTPCRSHRAPPRPAASAVASAAPRRNEAHGRPWRSGSWSHRAVLRCTSFTSRPPKMMSNTQLHRPNN